MKSINPFHLAIPVANLKESQAFYEEILGCSRGRSSEQWIDYNLFGHQLVIHHQADMPINNLNSNPVDGHDVPIPHFGVVLPFQEWQDFANLLTQKKLDFLIEPYIRFKGEVGEQGTMFFLDPSGNALEFKGFRDMEQIFAS